MSLDISKEKEFKGEKTNLEDNFMHEYFAEFLKLDEAQFQIR